MDEDDFVKRRRGEISTQKADHIDEEELGQDSPGQDHNTCKEISRYHTN